MTTFSNTWSISSGELPSGISLDSNTGVISGSPQVAQNYTFTVKAMCSIASVTKTFSIKVTDYPTVRVRGAIDQYFEMLQDAYNAVAEGNSIDIKGIDLYENLYCNRDVIISLNGGYANNFVNNDLVTIIHGDIIIMLGTVIVDNLVLMP